MAPHKMKRNTSFAKIPPLFLALSLAGAGLAKADVSVARCNLPDGTGTFSAGAIVWQNQEKRLVRIGEFGLTQQVLAKPDALLVWLQDNFATGDAAERVGFNDCSGSHMTAQTKPPAEPSDQEPTHYADLGLGAPPPPSVGAPFPF